jgi:hypothetical protein
LILGGGVAMLNFWWLWQIMEKLLLEKKRHYVFQVLIKFLILSLVLFMVIRYGRVNAVAFLVGISTLVMGIFFEAFWESLMNSRKGVW